MAAASTYSRGLPKQLWAKSARPFTRPGASNSFLRVSCACFANNHHQTLRNSFSDLAARFKQARNYATTAAKPVRKPKTATRRTTGTKKAGPKKAAAKKGGVRKAKKKVIKKAKAKKPKVKKEPSKTALLQKARKARAELRSVALLDKPKQLPATAYTLLVVSEGKGSSVGVAATASSASAKYRSLSAEEREVRTTIPFETIPTDLYSSVLITKRTQMRRRMRRNTRNGFKATHLLKSRRRTMPADSLPHKQELLVKRPSIDKSKTTDLSSGHEIPTRSFSAIVMPLEISKGFRLPKAAG